MSGPVEGRIVATGISGRNNIVNVKGDFIVTGQENNENILPSIPPRETSIWFEVRKPVESFTGRRKEFENLHKEVQRDLEITEHKLTVISQVTSICGLGGIGKSEIARMYARKHGQEYDGNVIWINAETYVTLTESFNRLANKLNVSTKSIDSREKNIDSIVNEVYKYFKKRKCLFIFDNAEKLRTETPEDEGIDKFLPKYLSIDDNEPYIIITSRNQKWGDKIKVLSLGTFTEEEAIEFITKELNVIDESQGKEICKLAQTLQCFPLALQQAVAYIKHTDEVLKNVRKKFEINDYLKRYEEKARELLDFDYPEDSSNCYLKTTFITWKVTLEKMKQKQYGQQALEVLETIAYFAPDNISTNIFLELVNDDIEKMASILQLPKQYSMIHLEEGVINIHRLVQQVIRLILKEQKKEKETLRRALKLIKTRIEEADAVRSKILPHAISAWNYVINDVFGILTNELIEFSNRITNKLFEDTRYQEAYTFAIQTFELLKGKPKKGLPSTSNTEYNIASVPCNQSTHEIFQNISKLTEYKLGAEHPSTLLTKNNIAEMLYLQRNYEKALNIFNEVFKIQERVLGGEHIDTLMTRNNIAVVLGQQGKYDEALRIYQDVLDIQERVLGEEHSNTSTSRHNMTFSIDKLGKFDEALRIYQDVLKIRERVLGGEHPDTLMTRNNMAFVLDKQGKYDEALGILQDVLKIRERVLAGEHPDTLTTRHYMAIVLKNQSKYVELLGNYQNILQVQERILGNEHPDTLTIRHNMAVVLEKQGKYKEALGIFQDVLNIQERILGKEHPDTLTIRHNMAAVLEKQGKYKEALGIFQDVLNIQERVLGGEHVDILITRNNMASVLYQQCNYDEALGNFQHVFKIRERVLGGEHPDTLMTKNNIAFVLRDQRKYNESLGIFQDVLNRKERVLGGEHPDTLQTRHNMASVLYQQCKYDEALGIYQHILNIRERVLGREHPDTLMTRNNMAVVLGQQCKYDEALGIYQDILNIRERVLGGEHTDTLMTRNNMALVLYQQCKYDEALGNFQHVLDVRERVLGREHPDTLMTKNYIAFAIDKKVKYHEALRIYKEVINTQEEVFVGKHPDTLMLMNLLGRKKKEGRKKKFFSCFKSQKIKNTY